MPKILLLAICLLGLSACANDPIIDSKGVNMNNYETDLAECEAYADEVKVGQRSAKSAAAGAALWAVIGAVFGNSDTAARGAAAGGATGAARGAAHGYQEKDQVIRRCLENRGYPVLN